MDEIKDLMKKTMSVDEYNYWLGLLDGMTATHLKIFLDILRDDLKRKEAIDKKYGTDKNKLKKADMIRIINS